MPNWEVMTALNAKLRSDDDSERQTKNSDGYEHQTEKRWWLWTPKLRTMIMALNAELKTVVTTLNAKTEDATLNVDLKIDDGSERRTEKWQWWLWTPKLRSDDDDSERQTKDATLNVDLKTDDGSERRN